jgi:hypothetical protein
MSQNKKTPQLLIEVGRILICKMQLASPMVVIVTAIVAVG